jgi:uncharacterized RDD family membrane protein YckC
MTYASWGKRAIALLIDLVILIAMLAIVFFSGRAGSGAAALWFAIVGYTIAASINVYNKCFRMGRSGQTWGKQAMAIGLVMEDTKRPMGFWRAVVRELAHAADYGTGVGLLRPLWDAKGQTFADKMMKTVAVDYPLRPAAVDAAAPRVAA